MENALWELTWLDFLTTLKESSTPSKNIPRSNNHCLYTITNQIWIQQEQLTVKITTKVTKIQFVIAIDSFISNIIFGNCPKSLNFVRRSKIGKKERKIERNFSTMIPQLLI